MKKYCSECNVELVLDSLESDNTIVLTDENGECISEYSINVFYCPNCGKEEFEKVY